ncbi:VOC family protein [Marinobacterium arenosum]|uniref:VOC family protein n=1 Tax=Marinobacterium arenosum TaxID=2862496 RepID=UPI001C96C64D|nr:VOC family protein [Marinobacterium arenosum]MBY4675867.1 VOC family protein [Marinobacterium arenosum]
MNYQLYVVRIFVHDWAGAVAFYRDILEMPCVFEDERLGWAQFQAGEAFIGVERVNPGDEKAAALVGRFVGVSLAVADIEASYRQLTNKGVAFSAPPQRQPWGGILAHFKDPEGNELTLLGTRGGSSVQ